MATKLIPIAVKSTAATLQEPQPLSYCPTTWGSAEHAEQGREGRFVKASPCV